MNEFPQMSGGSYASRNIDWQQFQGMIGAAQQERRIAAKQPAFLVDVAPVGQGLNFPQRKEQAMAARIVKVFMADPDENIVLDKRILYTGDEKLTDSTDQELFFEIPIADLLTKHNALRCVTLDRKATAKTGKDVFLEPIRIRDLRMVVVTVAQF